MFENPIGLKLLRKNRSYIRTDIYRIESWIRARDKTCDVSLGRLSLVKFFKRTFKSAKNFKSPPTTKSTGRERFARAQRDLKVKQNLHYTAKPNLKWVTRGVAEKTDGISCLDPIKVP